MSKDELKKKVYDYMPNTPEEWSQIGCGINRLGIIMSGIGAFQDKMLWVLISLGATWLGHEVSEYFKIYTARNVEPKDESKTE